MSTEPLDHVLGVLSVQRLQAEYCHGADKRDLSRFLQVWHEDGVWDVGTAVFRGRAEIAEAVRRQWSAIEAMHHWTSNATIDVSGDTATAESDASSLARVDGRWLLSAGTYTDHFERRDGRWGFTRRTAAVHATVEVPDAATVGGLGRDSRTDGAGT